MARIVEHLKTDVEGLTSRDVQSLLTRANYQGQAREAFLQAWEKKAPSTMETLAQILCGYCWVAGAWRPVTPADVNQQNDVVGDLNRKLAEARNTFLAMDAQCAAAEEKRAYDRDPAGYLASRFPAPPLAAAGDAGDAQNAAEASGTSGQSTGTENSAGGAVSGAPAEENADVPGDSDADSAGEATPTGESTTDAGEPAAAG